MDDDSASTRVKYARFDFIAATIPFVFAIGVELLCLTSPSIFRDGRCGIVSRRWLDFVFRFNPEFKLVVPLWFVMLLTSALYFSYVSRELIILYRCRKKLCVFCAYDRSTLESDFDRCPECGMDNR